MSRKIPEKLDDNIDNIIIKYGRTLYPTFRKLNFTANDITTLSLISGFISVYFLYKKRYILSSIMYFVSYIFDCLDGNYARTYKLVSKFGDYYDHMKDLIIGIMIYYLLHNPRP